MSSANGSSLSLWQRSKSTVLVVVVLAIGVAGFNYITASAPKPQRVKPQPVARLVEAVPVTLASSRPYWLSGGEVRAAEQVALAAQVSARVVQLSGQALPGARLAKGTLLAQLEKADFEFALQQQQAALAQAEAQLQIEQGQAALAQEEYAIAAQPLSEQERALVLREPQIASARAAVATARANVQQARLNLARTEIRMPFDGQILARHISTGSQVGSSTPLFEVVRTDHFWVEVKVPRTFLPLLDTTASALVMPAGADPHGHGREASILHVLPGVSDSDRQAVVLLQINNPLGGDLPVLAGDYVSVQLPGRVFEQAVVIDSRYLQDDGTVWVVHQNQLQRRQPEVLFRGREQVWLGKGFSPEDRILSSRVDAAVAGMSVRLQEPRP
ncbi:efflux RND transporter periplasmic adaptor subunit [Oceanospirillaceae bacterium ASx5O]|nr:efflux RND transporter periplasmic adaptor subunit [Oceanospirillaceae bacterium ASx5O]